MVTVERKLLVCGCEVWEYFAVGDRLGGIFGGRDVLVEELF